MSSDRFISERKGAWQRLEELLDSLHRLSLRGPGREEVRELGRLYRRPSSDLAIAFAVFLAFGLVGFVGTWLDPDFSELAGLDYAFRDTVNSRTRWWESLNRANQVGGAMIMANNIQVMFNAFALGAVFGLGTLYVMAYNGILIGAVLALTYRAGFGHELVAFMAGHGVIELTCIFIAGGAGLLVGNALLAPGDLSRFDALRLRGREAVHLIVGCVPLLVVAGTIEGFISPAPISPFFKYSIAIITGIALYSYLLLSGRETTNQRAG